MSAQGDDTRSVTPGHKVADMALYSLARARVCVAALDGKEQWDIGDTASFDCMHYLGDDALHNAARELKLRPGETVLDIGSGFSATGRFLHSYYGVNVTGVELQPEIHALAETITKRNGMETNVRSVNDDFLQMAAVTPVDHIVSILCILHIPDRQAIFGKAASMLSVGGKMYVEDFYARKPLDSTAQRQLREVVSCPYLPSREQYIRDLEESGFGDVQFHDMSAEWSDYVHARAARYRQSPNPESTLLTFYATVDTLFRGGLVGGVRISAARV